MYNEISIAAIPFRIREGKREFLLIQQSANHLWEFPKGNQELGEVEVDTLKRELKEETGLLPVRVISGFRADISYTFMKNKVSWLKQEVYYIVELRPFESVVLSWEHSAYCWCSFEEVIRRIPFENVRDLFINSVNYLERNVQPQR